MNETLKDRGILVALTEEGVVLASEDAVLTQLEDSILRKFNQELILRKRQKGLKKRGDCTDESSMEVQ